MADPIGVLLDSAEAGPRLIRGTLLRAIGYGVGLLLGIVSSAVVLRHLGVVDAGRLITVLALITIVGGISDLGLSSLALRDYATLAPRARGAFMSNLLGLRVVLATLAVGAAMAFGAIAGYTSAMIVGTLLAGLGLLLGIVQQTFSVPLSAALRLGWVTVLTLLVQIGGALGFISLALLGAGLTPFYGVQIVVLIPVLTLTLVLAGRETRRVRPAFDRSEWGRIMSQIVPYAVAVVFYVLYFRFAVISVSLLSSDTQTGYYGASFRIFDVLSTIPPLLASSAFPLLARVARDDRERFRYAVTRLFQGMLILGTWVAMSIGLAARLAIDVVAGDKFHAAIQLVQVQSGALIGTSLLAIWGYGLLSLGQNRSILFANAVSVTVAGALSIALIPSHGALGGAIALTAAELSLAAGYGFALMRAEPKLLAGLRAGPRVLVAAALAVGAPLALGVSELAAVAVATAVYIPALILLRAVPWELRDALLPMRRG